ncbi:tryptophan synthase beta subunit-like PLP-dependent enzyme [Aspergillus oleicola]
MTRYKINGTPPLQLQYSLDPRILSFHQRLPGYTPTPLIPLDSLARELGVKHVFLKDESSRAELPAFKILGASWATCLSVAQAVNTEVGSSFANLSAAAREKGIKLAAATDGNHGRAVARMAKILGLEAYIFVPLNLDRETKELIAQEGAKVVACSGDYDATVLEAKERAEINNWLLIQDTAFEGYTEIAQWIVDGYSTMMVETDKQVRELTGSTVDMVVAPVGVGSFAQSVISYWRSREHTCATVTVEPDSAACLLRSLISKAPTTVSTKDTIMAGLNCGTVSTIAWPVLRDGVEASIAVSDSETHAAVRRLKRVGISAGPCGAATYAALRRMAREKPLLTTGPGSTMVPMLRPEATVVLFCTEGARNYEIQSSYIYDHPILDPSPHHLVLAILTDKPCLHTFDTAIPVVI